MPKCGGHAGKELQERLRDPNGSAAAFLIQTNEMNGTVSSDSLAMVSNLLDRQDDLFRRT